MCVGGRGFGSGDILPHILSHTVKHGNNSRRNFIFVRSRSLKSGTIHTFTLTCSAWRGIKELPQHRLTLYNVNIVFRPRFEVHEKGN